MAVDVIMPAMGATQETGRLVRWFKREGDSVTKGEMLMEVETDKSVVEVEAPASGILAQVTAAPDDEIPVGQVIALIVEPGERVSPSEQSIPSAPKAPKSPDTTIAGPVQRPRRRHTAPRRKAAKSPVAATEVPAAGPDAGRLLASPAAKRLARERGVDISGVAGTGPEGAVLARDVTSMAPSASAEAGVPVPLSRMRRLIGERMTSSKKTAPHFYLSMEVDMTGVEARRNAMKQQGAGPVPSFNDFILEAVARALAESPSMNASWTDEGIEQHGEVNIGMAVAVDDGLVVPVIRNADKLPLEGVGAAQPRAGDPGSEPQADTRQLPGRYVHGIQPRHVRR